MDPQNGQINIEGQSEIEEQVKNQMGQTKIKLTIDDRNITSTYASGFRPSATAEEVMIDFGMNHLRPSSNSKQEREIIFQANNRIILNYFTAKRLAIILGQVIRRYEQEFGEIELDASKRRNKKSK